MAPTRRASRAAPALLALLAASSLPAAATGDDGGVPRSIPPEWRPDAEAASLLYVETDGGLPATQMPAVGNGYLATQIGSDAVYVAGVFNGAATEAPSHRARIPSPVNFRPPGNQQHAALHLREATYYRRSWIPAYKDAWFGFAPCGPWWANTAADSCTASTAKLWVEQRWYAHRVLRSVLVHEVEVIGDDATVAGVMEARHLRRGSSPLYRKPYAAPEDVVRDGEAISQPGNARPLALLKMVNNPGPASPDIGFHDMTASYRGVHEGCGVTWSLRVGNIKAPETADSEVVAVAVLTSGPIPHDGHLSVTKSGVAYPLITVVKTSLDLPPGTPAGSLEDALVAAAVDDYRLATWLAQDGLLHATHVAAWASLWRAGVSVGGRPDIAPLLNASLYSIVSNSRSDWPWGPSPGGLSTNGYNGHTFWDHDTFTQPALTLLHPGLAQAALAYRLHRLPGARAKAASYPDGGFRGAMFPWESAFTGVETCPAWAPTGTHEVHISADVAVSVWQYWQASRDVGSGWLREVGYPLLAGIADFWVSRAVADTPGAVVAGYNDGTPGAVVPAPPAAAPAGTDCAAAPGACALHIADVIPPTEFYHHVADSVYTSAAAKLALRRAVDAARVLGLLASTYASWANASDRLYVPFTTYAELAAPGSAVGSLPGLGNTTALAAGSPPGAGLHPYFSGYAWGDGKVQLLDPLMLAWPLGVGELPPGSAAGANVTDGGVRGYGFSRQSYLADLAYYTAAQDPGGSVAFAWAVNAIAFAEGDDAEKAAHFFARSFETFVFGPFRVWAEGSGGWGVPNFVTGAGGFVEAAIFGFPRLRVTDAGLSLRPWLLGGGATSHALRGVAYLGNALDIAYDGASLTIAVGGAVTPALEADGAAALAPGGGFPFRSPALDALRARLAGALPLAQPAPGDDGRGAFNVTAPGGAFGGRPGADPRNPAATVRDVLAGRPWLGGRAYPVAQRPLVVVDATGVGRPLPANGTPVVLPAGPVSIVDAADWDAAHPSPSASPSPAPSAAPSASPSPTPSSSTAEAAPAAAAGGSPAPAAAAAAAAGNVSAPAAAAAAPAPDKGGDHDDDGADAESAAAALRRLLRRRRERRKEQRDDDMEAELAALLRDAAAGGDDDKEGEGGSSGGRRKGHGRRKQHHGGDGAGDGDRDPVGDDGDADDDSDELEALLARAVLGKRKKRGHGGD